MTLQMLFGTALVLVVAVLLLSMFPEIKEITDGPESSTISVPTPPTLPATPAACNLIVATIMMLLGLTDVRDTCKPW